jgi:hypothetical protein
MGEARRRQLAQVAGLPADVQITPETPQYVLVEISFKLETYTKIITMMQEYNEEIAKAKGVHIHLETVPDFATFLAKSIIPRGLTAFDKELAAFVRSRRSIVLPGEHLTGARIG